MALPFSGYTRDLLIHQAKTLHSRVHPLKTLPGWIKREDELSFGISGPKLRKLLPLIHSLKKERVKGVILCGSCYSNFILGAVQLLIENEIDYHLVLNQPHTQKITGNYRYLKRIAPEEKISFTMPTHLPYRVIKEGGDEIECLEGAKTLAQSIYRNEEELDHPFSKIIIDAGTGVSAIGLILGLSQNPRPIHVFSMKIDEKAFFNKLGNPRPDFVFFHSLTKYKSFGSTHPSLLQFIDDFARKEGLFLDPIYGAKMVYELTHFKQEILDDASLLIHSGGALSLSGFE